MPVRIISDDIHALPQPATAPQDGLKALRGEFTRLVAMAWRLNDDGRRKAQKADLGRQAFRIVLILAEHDDASWRDVGACVARGLNLVPLWAEVLGDAIGGR